MGAGRTKLSAMLLTAAIWSSITVIIRCSNAWKAERKGFPEAYENISQKRRKTAENIRGRQSQK